MKKMLVLICCAALFCSCSRSGGVSSENDMIAFSLHNKSFNLKQIELWLAVYDEPHYGHLKLFDKNGNFCPQANLQLYKLGEQFKTSFCRIANDQYSFEDSCVEIYKEKFAFIMVQNGVVVQIIAPDIEGGNFGDYPVIPKPSYELSSWNKSGVEKLVKMVHEATNLTKPFTGTFPHSTAIIENYD